MSYGPGDTPVVGMSCLCSAVYVARGDVGERVAALSEASSPTYHPPIIPVAAPQARAAGWVRRRDGQWLCPKHVDRVAGPLPARMTFSEMSRRRTRRMRPKP